MNWQSMGSEPEKISTELAGDLTSDYRFSMCRILVADGWERRRSMM